jgi:protein gp37
MSKRLQAMGIEKYKDNFEVRLHPRELRLPYTWKQPRMVFVNSMSDLFHPDIPLHFIQQVFKAMNENPQHIFQVLTKRADRLLELHKELEWSDNIWMGVSVEDERVIERIDMLRNTNAKVKFLSLEPLIGPLSGMNLSKIDWVIVGGESGSRARPMKLEWVQEIKAQCRKAKTAFFFKQWGGKNKKMAGRELDGRTYDEMPLVVRASGSAEKIKNSRRAAPAY